MTHHGNENWRRRARYRIAIAGTLLGAWCCGTAHAEFSSASFARIWQEEIGSKVAAPAPPAARLAPLGNLPYVANPPAADSPAALPLASNKPHPAVVRVVVPEGEATSFGSGTLIDVREQYGLIITNWHVVRDARGPIEVIFPDGTSSMARSVKVDRDWDLAALVIWRPQVEPVRIASNAPQPGDPLTICGYGPGIYRSVTGRCTQYYSPQIHLPQQMVELNVEARQGDSGGPIFNDRGELAGVLFGAGQGTTLGSFGGRVDAFLATLAPDIGRQPADSSEAFAKSATKDPFAVQSTADQGATSGNPWQSQPDPQSKTHLVGLHAGDGIAKSGNNAAESGNLLVGNASSDPFAPLDALHPLPAPPPQPRFEQVKNALAAVGIVAIALMILKAAG